MKKFLADESVDFRIVKSLRNEGYQIEAIVELESGVDDDDVLKMALELEAILLTEDKDLGELTFRLQKTNQPIQPGNQTSPLHPSIICHIKYPQNNHNNYLYICKRRLFISPSLVLVDVQDNKRGNKSYS